MDKQQLDKILENHKLWLEGGGEKASALICARLICAGLIYMGLIYAGLIYAGLI